jgi:glycosyltransferase involved in cell wall biosynthesis
MSHLQKAKAVSHWAVVASFFQTPQDRWIDDFVSDPAVSFSKVLPPGEVASWHDQKGRTTAARTWLIHLAHMRAAFRGRPDGVIACFPQLAMCAALLKRLGRRKPRIIAYNYNLGGFPGGLRRRIARAVASEIDIFVVHSPTECQPYAEYLGVDVARVRFVPLQRGDIPYPRDEDGDDPYILAMGSAGRDYESLIEAVAPLGLRTVIVTRPDIVAALPERPRVEFLSGLTQEDCLRLLARARLLVTPISNLDTASGQITFVNALRLGVASISTRCPGTDGYIRDGQTGILVPPFDAASLGAQIERLWHDAPAREAIAAAGLTDARARFSDEAAARTLAAMIADLEGREQDIAAAPAMSL